jgi:hypothetical protein
MASPLDPLTLNRWVMCPMYLKYHRTMSQTFEEIFLGRFSHCLFSIYNVAVSLKVTQVEFGKQHDLGL